MAPITNQTKKILSTSLPRAASLQNPVDVLGDALANRYQSALEAVLQERQVHAAERAIQALAAMWHWQRWRQGSHPHKKHVTTKNPLFRRRLTRARQTLADIKDGHGNILTGVQSQALLRQIGLPTPRETVVTTPESAITWSEKITGPIVLKISSKKILHKAEVHGVVANLTDPNEIKRSFASLTKAIKKLSDPAATIQIQEHIRHGQEVIVGFKRDPSFGSLLLFGSGGTLAELVKDQQLILFPLSTTI